MSRSVLGETASSRTSSIADRTARPVVAQLLVDAENSASTFASTTASELAEAPRPMALARRRRGAVAADPRRLALQSRYHLPLPVSRRRQCASAARFRSARTRTAHRQDRAEHAVNVPGDGLRHVTGEAGEVVSGMKGRFLPPVPASPADDEADSLRRCALWCIPRLTETLQEPRHTGQLVAGLLSGRSRLSLHDPAGQLRLTAPGIGQGPQSRRRRMGIPGISAVPDRGRSRPAADPGRPPGPRPPSAAAARHQLPPAESTHRRCPDGR